MSIYGTASSDTMYGTYAGDYILGLQGNDAIYGLDGDDVIYGGKDNDYINGGNGNDYLSGDLGSDYLIGGAGYDRFAFSSSGEYGYDQIADFQAGWGGEVIQLNGFSGYGINNFNDVLSRTNNISGGLVIDLPYNSIQLDGVYAHQLTSSNFAFY